MDDNTDNTQDPEWLRHLPIRSEEVGYAADELIECGDCGRRNAPDRPACLYCGAGIDSSAAKRVELVELESWENGYNVVAVGTEEADSERIAQEFRSLLRSNGELIEPLLRAKKAFPVARVGTSEQAASISALLASLNVKSVAVSDTDLLRKTPPMRLRSVEFNDDHLRLIPFAGADAVVLQATDLALVVSCVLMQERRESTEKRKRRSTATVDEIYVSSDQPIIDIYSRTDPTGWRIPMSGFDFSSLGEEKSLLAHENMRRVAQRLMEFSPAVRVIDDYLSLRSALEICWPSDHSKETKGLNTVSFRSKKTTKVFTTDNTVQVTKYSRLQWHLL